MTDNYDELRQQYFDECFEFWNEQRDTKDTSDMYRQFAKFMCDQMYDVTQEKQFQEVTK